MLLSTIIGYLYVGKNTPNFLCSRTIGILSSLLFTITFFYTYTGIIGTNFSLLDIGSFFIAVIIGEYVSYKITFFNYFCNKKIAIAILIILLLCFLVFTYFPPKIGLFKDPVTNAFGIIKEE